MPAQSADFATAHIQGKFLLSLNDTPEIREIFGGFDISTADTVYSTGMARKKVSELLIRNY